MGQQVQTQPAVHTGVPGVQATPSPFGGVRGSMAVPTRAPFGVPPPSVQQPRFAPRAMVAPNAPPGAPGSTATPPSYALALRNT